MRIWQVEQRSQEEKKRTREEENGLCVVSMTHEGEREREGKENGGV